MPLKSSKSGSETRNRLLAVAAKRVHVQGFRQTSLDQIAADAHIAKATIYHHFRNKEELGSALIDFNVHQYEAFLKNRVFDSGVAGVERLNRLCEFVVNEFDSGNLEMGCPICNLVSELAYESEGFRAQIDAFFIEYRDLIEVALQDARKAQHLAFAGSLRDLATLFLAQLQGNLLLARTTIKNHDRHFGARQLRQSFQALFSALGLPYRDHSLIAATPGAAH